MYRNYFTTSFIILNEDPYTTYKGSTLTCRLRFCWNFQDSKVVVGKDTQAQNLLPECIFSTLKTALKIEQKC